MIAEELHNNTKVVNKKYGTEELVLMSDVMLKDSQKGWIPAVLYVGQDRLSSDNSLKIFCKNKEDFLKEFEVVVEHPKVVFKFKVGDKVICPFNKHYGTCEITQQIDRDGKPWYRLKYVGLLKEEDLELYTEENNGEFNVFRC